MPKRSAGRSWLLLGIAGGLMGAAALSHWASAQQPAPNFGMPPVHDPGVRGGSPGAGGPLPGLDAAELAFFTAAANRFQEIDSVSGAISGQAGSGLGPRFNSNSCSSCHAQPAVGGTGPAVNPQIAVARLAGARNTIPSFISLNGPVREARFVNNPNGTADGGVHDLFVITGRSDAPGCNIAQTNFAAALAANNVIFRIPTPVFGLGLVEGISDLGLENGLAEERLPQAAARHYRPVQSQWQ